MEGNKRTQGTWENKTAKEVVEKRESWNHWKEDNEGARGNETARNSGKEEDLGTWGDEADNEVRQTTDPRNQSK